ncbi:LysR family transcriptional regulator [Entomohabitans teleogrylli]|uniref:LysR family transcriptional regulator n=1 Tax=Entomohabitans teleogrylli TaxID=1384589 RepID=UPI00073D2980|nr:LysR family transcriptional regulator [Entomohabitans teleogrylli]
MNPIQPALTKQIQTLEHLTGMRLFLRGRQGARLTVAGQQLYSRARDLIGQHDEFCEYVRQVRQGSVGRLALGFGISTFQLAPALVRAFREQFPAADVSLNDIPSDEQCRMLLDGQLHGGFVRLPVPDPLLARVVMTERLVLAVPSGLKVVNDAIHALIHHHPLLQISPKRGRGLSEQAASFLKANDIRPAALADADDIHTLLALVAAGNGVALLPAGASHIVPSGVMLVPLEGQCTRWQVGIAWNPALENALRDNFINSATGTEPAALPGR